eukprot:Pgem_evm1s16868
MPNLKTIAEDAGSYVGTYVTYCIASDNYFDRVLEFSVAPAIANVMHKFGKGETELEKRIELPDRFPHPFREYNNFAPRPYQIKIFDNERFHICGPNIVKDVDINEYKGTLVNVLKNKAYCKKQRLNFHGMNVMSDEENVFTVEVRKSREEVEEECGWYPIEESDCFDEYFKRVDRKAEIEREEWNKIKVSDVQNVLLDMLKILSYYTEDDDDGMPEKKKRKAD